ncbi:Uncharacterised protein [Kluyvera cryocrescens]|uniref:Uncharacterized protein n=1 Tax=Kluyvera cryocrescens TaxID=580 RepID=A0A485CG69_KLUCR|nr:Uncharacterised protein [Kluyvera cryocrescens]
MSGVINPANAYHVTHYRRRNKLTLPMILNNINNHKLLSAILLAVFVTLVMVLTPVINKLLGKS